jgi:DNA-directed RNA polymerase subunit H (RpoH/RPB5)
MLPKIKITDPQVVWLNAKIGDVILITRNDITGPVLYYRLVV